MSMRNTVRTFVAVEIPPETQSAGDRSDQSFADYERQCPLGRAEQLHWTLKFLGEVDLNDVPEICDGVAQATANIEPFDVEAFGAGLFPIRMQPRTIWLGVGEGTDQMIALHGAIENELGKLGFRKEQRRFRPHVTLGECAAVTKECRASTSDQGKRRFRREPIHRI